MISGSRREGVSSCQAIDQLMEMLEPLESEIVTLATSQDREESDNELLQGMQVADNLHDNEKSFNAQQLESRLGESP